MLSRGIFGIHRFVAQRVAGILVAGGLDGQQIADQLVGVGAIIERQWYQRGLTTAGDKVEANVLGVACQIVVTEPGKTTQNVESFSRKLFQDGSRLSTGVVNIRRWPT